MMVKDNVYLPGLFGLEWQQDGERYVSPPVDREFADLFFGWKKALTEIGYGLVKIDGKWTATFQPGLADKPTILATVFKIREQLVARHSKGK